MIGRGRRSRGVRSLRGSKWEVPLVLDVWERCVIPDGLMNSSVCPSWTRTLNHVVFSHSCERSASPFDLAPH